MLEGPSVVSEEILGFPKALAHNSNHALTIACDEKVMGMLVQVAICAYQFI